MRTASGVFTVLAASAVMVAAACSLSAFDGFATGTTGTGGHSGTMGAGTGTTSTGGGGTTSASSAASTGTGGSTGSGTGGGPCAADRTCVVPPPGWSGPIVLKTGTTMPQCVDPGWLTPVPALGDGMTGLMKPTSCEACSCNGPPTNAVCPTSASINEYEDSACSTLEVPQPITVKTTCTTLIGIVESARGAPTDATATCTGATPAPASQPGFAERAIGCSPTASDPCEVGGTCADVTGPTCIYAGGTTPCPPSYPNQTLVYQGLTGGYSCTPCTCVATGVQCKPTVQLFYGACINNLLASGLLDGVSCLESNNPNFSATNAKISNVGTPAGGTCSVTGGGALMGSASGTNPVTVCCSS